MLYNQNPIIILPNPNDSMVIISFEYDVALLIVGQLGQRGISATKISTAFHLRFDFHSQFSFLLR